MKKQNYNNHVRFYAPYHFILLPLLAIIIFLSVYYIFKMPAQHAFYVWITIVLLFIFWVTVMMRQHYALNNQNRIVRLEMRLRYLELTGKRFQPVERVLSFEQIAALRFASDEEFLPLLDRTVSEKLSPKQIKEAINNWVGDYMRV